MYYLCNLFIVFTNGVVCPKTPKAMYKLYLLLQDKWVPAHTEIHTHTHACMHAHTYIAVFKDVSQPDQISFTAT